jgi:hypothetical protein
MADNTKIWPIFRWANGGLSDDLFTGIRNSFYFSNDMEVREDAKSIFPKPVPAYADANKWVTVWDWWSGKTNVVNVTYSLNDGWWLVCTDKYVYNVANNWTVTQLCVMWENICDLEIFNWYVYITTRTHIYYKKDDWNNWGNMASAENASQADYWRMMQALNSNVYHPLYASDICLCVWDTNVMWKVTREIPDTLQSWFTLQKWWYIRHITELWWFVRVVALDLPYWSNLLLWDKISETVNDVIPLEWHIVIWTVIYWGYQYLLSDRWLWLINWYQYYILKKAKVNVTSTTNPNCMCVYDDKLYFIANDGVYIYWAKNKNYADVLVLWHKVEDWYTLWAIWSAVRTIWWNSLMITRNYKNDSWTDYPIKVWMNEWQATTWEVQTMCYFWTSMSEIKQSMYLRVGYHIPKQWDNSGNIHIYYRTEADANTDTAEDWGWHELTKPDWLYTDWDMRSPFATTLKLNCRFQRIQFKFVLTNCVYTEWWVTKTKDTNLYSADLYYNDMLD